mmetsp:Transcript_10470/g.12370  ORF Transcript_10470/g.12370 Transcript_10470/m.12370 type:complete len:99 (-) Transcript_10470:167-463(-)
MFKNLIRVCSLERYRSDEALLDLKSPLLGLNELHSQALMYLIELWKIDYNNLMTKHSNKGPAVQGKKSAARSSAPGDLNIIELSQISERVIQAATGFL